MSEFKVGNINSCSRIFQQQGKGELGFDAEVLSFFTGSARGSAANTRRARDQPAKSGSVTL